MKAFSGILLFYEVERRLPFTWNNLQKRAYEGSNMKVYAAKVPL